VQRSAAKIKAPVPGIRSRQIFIERSLSVRCALVRCWRGRGAKSASPVRNPCQIMGSDRTRLMMPPAATAPRQYKGLYAPRISSGPMSRISFVPGDRAVGKPSPKNL
jgi:hypothetical protein